MKKKTLITLFSLIILGVAGFVCFNLYAIKHGKPWEEWAARKKMQVYIDNNFRENYKIEKVKYDIKHSDFFADVQTGNFEVPSFRIEIVDGEVQNYYYASYWEAQIFGIGNPAVQQYFHGKARFKVIFQPREYEKTYGEQFDTPPDYAAVKDKIAGDVSLLVDLPYNWEDDTANQEIAMLYQMSGFIKSTIPCSQFAVSYKNKLLEFDSDELKAITNKEEFQRFFIDSNHAPNNQAND